MSADVGRIRMLSERKATYSKCSEFQLSVPSSAALIYSVGGSSACQVE